jgi:hypothetical protein
MSQYEQTARNYWETYLPSATAELDDPTTFFRELAQQVEDQIESAVLTPPTVDPEASAADREQAYAAALRAARETALADLVYLPPEPGTETKRLTGWTPPGWTAAEQTPASETEPAPAE